MNQLHSVCHKRFEPFAFIVDITKDNLTICPEVFPDTCQIPSLSVVTSLLIV